LNFSLGPQGQCTRRFTSDVRFMSTACGRPQGGGGSQKFNFLVDVLNR